MPFTLLFIILGMTSPACVGMSTTVRHLFHLKVSVFNLEINF